MFTQMTACALVAVLACTASGQVQNERQKILTTNGGEFDRFGFAVAISSGVVSVGSPGDETAGSDGGAVFLYDAQLGVGFSELLPQQEAFLDAFGTSVAMSGSKLIVGAPIEFQPFYPSGAAYLFDVSGSRGGGGVLLPSDAATAIGFGIDVGISEAHAVVGESGHGVAYLFELPSGKEIARLVPDDESEDDAFGTSVAVSEQFTLVGASDDGDNGPSAGAVYVFDTSTGNRIMKLKPAEGEAVDKFGFSVAIDGSLAFIGATGDDDVAVDAGAVYVFDLNARSMICKLIPNSANLGMGLGWSVSVSGDTLIAGAPLDDENAPVSGAAYVFDLNTCTQIVKLLPSDGAFFDQFGISVGISDGIAVVGAFGDEDLGSMSGSAYLFDIELMCSSDIADAEGADPDGIVNLFDLLLLLDNWGTSGAGAAISDQGGGSTVVDLFDLLAMLDAWGSCN